MTAQEPNYDAYFEALEAAVGDATLEDLADAKVAYTDWVRAKYPQQFDDFDVLPRERKLAWVLDVFLRREYGKS